MTEGSPEKRLSVDVSAAIALHFQDKQQANKEEINKNVMNKQFKECFEACGTENTRFENFVKVQTQFMKAVKLLSLSTKAKVMEAFAKKRFLYKDETE